MRIMQVVSGSSVNGAVIHAVLLIRELIDRGHEVTLVCRPGAWVAEQMRHLPVDVIESDMRRWPVAELKRIAKLARERKIDVLHTHMSRAHFFGVLLRLFWRIPCTATAHSRSVQLHWCMNDYVIANSEATRKYQCNWNMVSQRRIETVHCFIEHERFESLPEGQTQATARETLGMDKRAPAIGIVGNVIPRKGLVYLVRALVQVVEDFPNVQLVVVGAGELDYITKCKNEALRLGVEKNIVWAGYQHDIPQVMHAIDLLVVPSLEEPQGLTALEAAAAKKPVIATAVGGLPESVLDGKTGLLVPPAKARPLAEAIVELLSDPNRCERMGSAGRDHVRVGFSPETQTNRIEAILKQVAATHRAA